MSATTDTDGGGFMSGTTAKISRVFDRKMKRQMKKQEQLAESQVELLRKASHRMDSLFTGCWLITAAVVAVLVLLVLLQTDRRRFHS